MFGSVVVAGATLLDPELLQSGPAPSEAFSSFVLGLSHVLIDLRQAPISYQDDHIMTSVKKYIYPIREVLGVLLCLPVV